MAKLKLAIVVGSNRRESINRKLAQALAKLSEGAFEPSFVQIDDLPMFNQDHEADRAEPTLRLKREIEAADAILIVTPEYNRAIPAVLKNAIDWASRPYGENSWAGKTVAVTGTSGSAVSSAVAQNELRMIMTNIAGVVVGSQVFINYKDGMFDAEHNVTDETTRGFLQGFIDNVATIAGKLAA